MAHHTASIHWSRGGAAFTDNRYSRAHEWRFDGGITVPASASPHIVRQPMSVAEAVDPEEAFVAALASCHMLFFLSFAAGAGLVVDDYADDAVGVIGPGADGRLTMTRVTLHPRVALSPATPPSPGQLGALHHRAHDACFLANAVRCPVECEPVVTDR